MKPKVLWIEDSARLELSNLTAPVYSSRKYDFDLAIDVTTAVNILRIKSFNAIVVDVRLPPGVNSHWRKHYKNAGSDKVSAQLGLKFLRWLLMRDMSIYPVEPPNGITASQIGMFTVEAKQDIQDDIRILKVDIFQQKAAGLPDTILLDLFDRILSQ
ncbi:MAG: hypothetical protein AB1564_06945 [Chloroflexota bacterium]